MLELPRPIPPHDAHTHSALGVGRDSVLEMVRAAEACGLEAIAITDVADGRTDLAPRIDEIRRINERSSVTVLAGAYCTILDASGRIDLPPRADRLALVLAAFGPATRGICDDIPADRSRLVENVFGALSAVVEREAVRVIADPFNLGRSQAAPGPSELPRAYVRDLARLMVEHEVALELSAQAWWWHPALSVGEFIREWTDTLAVFSREGVKFVAGTGARDAAAVGNNHFTRRIMRLAGIELSQVVNLRSLARD